MCLKYLLAASIMLAVCEASSQARIIDSKPMGEGQAQQVAPAPRSRQSSQERGAGSTHAQQADLYYQLQLLQEEVQTLRGLVEQQSYELKRLKQQRLDDYLDLDRRISALSSGVGASGTVAPSGSVPGSTSTSVSRSNGQAQAALVQKGEFASYQAAIGLALKQRDFDRSLSALKEHLEKFPGGSYEANAQYWLGQIYLQKGELEQSKKWFSEMTRVYPRHQKTHEAKFKLGQVLHKMGDSPSAKALLKEVASSGSSAASLAQDYLKQNF